MSMKIVIRFAFLAATAVLLGGCPFGGSGNIVPAMKQIPAETQVLLAKSGMTQEAPIFVRIFKEEAELEIWKEKTDGRYYLFKTYPICTFSGELGPKIATGDKQSPEGFYTVTPGQMNPNSQFHLAFNLGYPNAYDKANGRTGSALMVHGDCRSAGCYAMTDALIEEIYALARESFRGGQSKFHVHAFPFRMTDENMKRHRDSKWAGFWRTLKTGYDDFELSRKPPKVNVCSRQYLVNASFMGFKGVPDPAGDCPAYRRDPIDAFNPFGDGQFMAKAPENRPAIAQGAQTSRIAAYAPATAGPKPDSSAAPTQTQRAAQPGAASQPPAAKPAAVSAELTLTARSPQPDQTGGEEPSGVSLAGSVAVQPFPRSVVTSNVEAQTPTAAFAPEAAEPQKKADQPQETPGMHNVVKSGKSDMIPSAGQPR